MIKKHCQRYFDKITPDKDQKNKIYERIIEKYELKNEVKVEKKKLFSVSSVLSAAAVTAAIGVTAFLIVSYAPHELTHQINTTSENEDLSADKSNLTSDKQYSESAVIQNILSNEQKIVVIYSLNFTTTQTEQAQTISADISTYINSESDPRKGQITFIRSGNMYVGEMIYELLEYMPDGEYNIVSELSHIQTDSGKTLCKKTDASCIRSVNDCENISDRHEIKSLGNTQKLSQEEIKNAFVEITPFQTTLSLPGYEDYKIEITDQNGNILNNLDDKVFDPVNTDTTLLCITASDCNKIQYFSVPVCGYRVSQYSGGKNLVSKNTVDALSVLNEYKGIYDFDSNKKYTDICDYYTSNPEMLIETGIQTYADSMFSSVSDEEISDSLSVSIDSSEFINISNRTDLINYEKIKELTESLWEKYNWKRFVALSVTYNIENTSEEDSEFYFYGGHPIMKNFAECFDDQDIINSNVCYLSSDDNDYADKRFSLSPGETQKIVLAYIVPAETISLGFYISAQNNGDFVLMDTK